MYKIRNIGAYLTLALVLVFNSCAKEQESYVVSEQKIIEAVYASGIVKAKGQYEVFAANQGLIQQVFVGDGDIVKQGQPLFAIQDMSSKLTSENAKLLADYAAWNSRGEKLEELKTNISLAEKKLQNDSLLFNRQKELWNQGIGSRIDFEQRSLALESSKANLKSLLSRLKDTQKELNFLKAQSTKQYNISTQNLSDFTVRSKIDGRVYDIKAKVGELAVMGRPLATVGASNRFELELQVDEKDISKIKIDQAVKVRMDAYDKQVFDATITHISPLMNEKARSFILEAAFISPPPSLYPFLTAEANIIIAQKEKSLVIPRSFLLNDSTVLTKNELQVKITTGLKDYQMVEITGGLSKGDIIYKKK